MAAERSRERQDDADGEEESHEAYFEELNDGCGCAEIWEYLSERRRSE